jgi:hypothetical protein
METPMNIDQALPFHPLAGRRRSANDRTPPAARPHWRVLVVAAAWLAVAALAFFAEIGPVLTAGPTRAEPHMVGVFTGELVDGVAVYRLPSVSVVAVREAELAKMERERTARAKRT